jgi:uncharacterized membrane protein YfcA
MPSVTTTSSRDWPAWPTSCPSALVAGPVDSYDVRMTTDERKSLLTTVAIGLVAGLLSGLLGVGGGIIMVPLLVLVAKLTQHEAHATSLAAIGPIATVGAIRFAASGNIDYTVALFLAAGSLAGAQVGARLMARAGETSLSILFSALMIVVAIQLLWP